jgi:hypothetical protein
VNALPILETECLRLCPFQLSDAGRVRELAGERAIADTTLPIPHPYEAGMAEEWIAVHAARFEKGEEAVFAITLTTTGTAAKTRVIIESTDGIDTWGTVGVHDNIIEASWEALVDSVEYKLFKDEQRR